MTMFFEYAITRQRIKIFSHGTYMLEYAHILLNMQPKVPSIKSIYK